MPREHRKRPASVHSLMATLLFQGVSGVIGGVALVVDPTGGIVHIPVRWLEGSLFDDYSIPGLILLLVLGCFPLVAACGVWKRSRWARPAAFSVGVALVVWIAVEIVIIGYHSQPPLQAFYGALGVVIAVVSLLPSAKRHFRDAEEAA